MIKNFLGRRGISRGIRNNNPGNIRITSNNWKGKLPKDRNTDGAFEQFENLSWGIRALLRDLTTKIEKRDLGTIRKIIAVYAPPNENNTEAYIQRVAAIAGIGPDTPLDASKATITKLAQGIIVIENRASDRHLITIRDINAAWEIF